MMFHVKMACATFPDEDSDASKPLQKRNSIDSTDCKPIEKLNPSSNPPKPTQQLDS